MRPYKFITTLAFLFLYFIGYSQNDVVVATDKNLEDANFDAYKTFTFADHISDTGNNEYFSDNGTVKATIRNEVKGELEALGYEYVENDADLLVNFRILEKPVEYVGWIDNYADDNYWGKFSLSARTREPDDKKVYHLDKGTLLIQMADLDKDIVVWSGYASGIVDYANLDNDKGKIDIAVEKIFDEYNFSAAMK